jgi:hypothetical protein
VVFRWLCWLALLLLPYKRTVAVNQHQCVLQRLCAALRLQ